MKNRGIGRLSRWSYLARKLVTLFISPEINVSRDSSQLHYVGAAEFVKGVVALSNDPASDIQSDD